jgi:hypothetical protein
MFMVVFRSPSDLDLSMPSAVPPQVVDPRRFTRRLPSADSPHSRDHHDLNIQCCFYFQSPSLAGNDVAIYCGSNLDVFPLFGLKCILYMPTAIVIITQYASW